MLSKRKLSPWFLLALLLVLGWVSFRLVGVFLNYVLTGLFLAYVTYPVYRWLQPRVRYRPLASILLVFGVMLIIVVPLTFLAVELVGELHRMSQGLDVATLQVVLGDLLGNLLAALGLGASEGEAGIGPLDILVPELNALMSGLVARMLSVAAEALIGVFVMVYVLYYAYIDGPRFVAWIRSIVPLHEAHRDLLFNEVGNVIQAVMYGHILTALIQAILGGIGLWIFGIPNVVFWSLLMFILALLPIVGPPLIWAPAGLYLLFIGDTFGGIGLLIYSAIMVSTLDNLIRPKLISDRARVHPVVVLLGVLGGIVVFGFSGLILGPLVLSIFVTVVDVYRKEFAPRLADAM